MGKFLYGSSLLKKAFLGDIEVATIYYGNTLLYKSGTRLSAPIISLNATTGVITITPDSRSTNMIIYDGGVVKVNTTVATTYNLKTSSSFDPGVHQISVKTIASGYTDSPFSNTITYNKPLETPVISVLNDDLLVIASTLTTSFDIYKNGQFVANQLVSGSLYTTVNLNNLLGTGSGSVIITVKSKADGYIDSDFSSSQTYKYRLPAPIISIEDEVLTITPTESYSSSYRIYSSSSSYTTTSLKKVALVSTSLSFDFGTTYNITVRAQPPNSNSRESLDSNAVAFKIDYCTMTVLANGNVYITGAEGVSREIEYKKNSGAWTAYTPTYGEQEHVNIPVVANDIIYFRGTNASGINDSSTTGLHITLTKTETGIGAAANLSGSIMSLIHKTTMKKAIPNDYCFRALFGGVYLGEISRNFFNMTTLTNNCFSALGDGSGSRLSNMRFFMPATTMTANMFGSVQAGGSNATLSVEAPFASTIKATAFKMNNTQFNRYYFTFGKLITTLESAWTDTGSGTFNITLPYEDSDSPAFDTSNIVYQYADSESSKYSGTYNIYTNNTAIKNACIAKRNGKTTVHVYHLDGTAWDV